MSAESTIKVPADAHTSIQSVVEAGTDNFLELVDAAKLNKRSDFVGMCFDEMRLDSLELIGFDFTDADFRRCSLKGTIFVECELKGSAFSFPPTVRDKWQRHPDFFLGTHDSDELELMRIASEATTKEKRREALIKLLEISNNDDVTSFLHDVSLNDKAKSLRHWLKSKLTGGFKRKEVLKPILERSLFEGGEDLNEDIGLYVKLMEGSNEAIETLCQVCAVNPRAIARASHEVGGSGSFQRLLIKNVSLSLDSQIWRKSAEALRNLDVDQKEKDIAFNLRLLRVKDRYDISQLAKTAASNNVRNLRLFELCERGYQEELDAWHADDFLLYCYFYERGKYNNDVLFYSFQEAESERKSISRSTAFGAYCFINAPELYRSLEEKIDYFYVDPLTLIGIKQDFYREDRFSAEVRGQLKRLSQLGYEQSRNVRVDDLIRRPE